MDQAAIRERSDRLQRLATEADQIIREIGPKMIRLAHLREEARTIVEELSVAQTSEP